MVFQRTEKMQKITVVTISLYKVAIVNKTEQSIARPSFIDFSLHFDFMFLIKVFFCIILLILTINLAYV